MKKKTEEPIEEDRKPKTGEEISVPKIGVDVVDNRKPERNKPKSYNPNFQNENRRKPDNRKAKSGDVRGRNRRDR